MDGFRLPFVLAKNLPGQTRVELDQKPSADEFWKILQRYFVFEEPSSRWAHLRRRMFKGAAKSLTPAVIAALSPLDQACLFADLYGTSQGNKGWADGDSVHINRLLNLVLAGKDIAKFQRAAFDIWAARVKQSYFSSVDRQDLSQIEELSRAIASKMNLSPSQMQWLQHSAIAVPNWLGLQENGPWANDSRAQLIRKVIRCLGSRVASFATAADESQSIDQYISHLDSVSQAFDEELRHSRPHLPANFLPERILLVEGQTELILIPHFARCLNFDWNSLGVMLVSAGGANEVVRRYLNYRELVAIPIDCLLDGDVVSHADALSEQLRDQDRLFTLVEGEIEEIFSREQLTAIANVYFAAHKERSVQPAILLSDVDEQMSKKNALARIWRKRGLGSFDKIGFAKAVAQSIRRPEQVPLTMVKIIERIANECGRSGA